MRAPLTTFRSLFLPDAWPHAVAPEYGAYQLWDTIQQVTFFVNTVISAQAIMSFHGVGDEDKTPAEATALGISRELLATSSDRIHCHPGAQHSVVSRATRLR